VAVESILRRTVVDLLEARLRDDILSGTHEPGSLLPPERELAAGYGVTRTTLKHALTRLEQAPTWLREVFEVRRQIGTLIAGRAADRRTERQARRLEHLLRQVADGPDADAVQLADVEVHRELARATGNRVYLLLTNTLFNAYLPVRASLRAPFENAARATDRLAPVVRAVVDRDGEEARRAAEAYLAGTEKIMLGSLSSSRGRPTADGPR
jgi:DNA-binding FadR family transcriptional regulator